jgi:hypothetical protein
MYCYRTWVIMPAKQAMEAAEEQWYAIVHDLYLVEQALGLRERPAPPGIEQPAPQAPGNRTHLRAVPNTATGRTVRYPAAMIVDDDSDITNDI